PLVYTSLFFNHPAPTETPTLSLHDALPIFAAGQRQRQGLFAHDVQPGIEGQNDELGVKRVGCCDDHRIEAADEDSLQVRGNRLRSEEHTSELQSQSNLVCRLLLEKKKKKTQ